MYFSQLLRYLELLSLLAKSTHYAYAQQDFAQLTRPLAGLYTGQVRSPLQIFNPSTGQQLQLTDFVPTLRGGKQQLWPLTGGTGILELPQLWQACNCIIPECSCCLGVSVAQNFNHTFCAVMEFNAADLSVDFRINYNRLTIVNYGFSARNPPSICMPLLLPLPLFGCLRVYNVYVIGMNVQLCIALNLRVFNGQLFEYKLNCVRFGIDGISFKDDGHALPASANDKLEFFNLTNWATARHNFS